LIKDDRGCEEGENIGENRRWQEGSFFVL